MKIIAAKYVLWLYETHIYEDWDEYTRIGKICIYPFWVIRSLLILITSPLWIISFHFTQSKVYQHYQEFGKAMNMEQQLEILKQKKINQKIERNNFLIQRQSKGKYNKKF
jgi:hypothetical protein